MLILLMIILVVLFAFVQQINNNLYVLDILCLDNIYFAGVPQIILLSRILRTHKSLPARTRSSRVVPCRTLLRWVPRYSRGSAGLYSKAEATSDQKEHKVSHLPKNILIIPKTFGQIFCGLMRQKFNFLEGVCLVTTGVKPTQNFIKRTSYQQSNMVVVV